MRIAQINSTCGIGSTGRICTGISELLTAEGVENRILYSFLSSGYPFGVQCASGNEIKAQAIKSKLSGSYGFQSKRATRRMICELERFDPDIVHLHNIHSHDCHLGMLFSYFRENRTKLIWTFHDCWAFTGYCPHFTMAGCDKWQSRCHHCVQKKEYSWFFDKSQRLFDTKKQLFTGLDLTIVTPSAWLAGIVKRSFLKSYPVHVIHNGIDLNVFQPTQSDFRQKYGVEKSKLILGVSFGWGIKKGLDVFIDLARRLPRDYKIVLIGTDDTADKLFDDTIISVHRTQDQRELAEIYTAADVFVNPTREENFPTVNLEALACGTPVVTFKTGGSPETIDDTCGSVVGCGDVDALEKEIIRVCEQRPFSQQACVNKAHDFDRSKRFEEYLKLYERIIPSRDQRD